MDRPFTHADFVRLTLAAFPELREEFEEDPDLLHVQMHAFTRLAERARAARDWATYRRCMMLADRLWQHPDDAVLNALNVSFLEHLEFEGPDGAEAWKYLSSALQEGWRAMDAYMKDLAALAATPKKVRQPKPRRRL